MTQHFELPNASSGAKELNGCTRFKDVFIPLRDGIKICADIFLLTSSIKSGEKVPVLTSLGPYGKDSNSAVFGLPKTDIYANMYKSIKPGGEDSVFEVVHPLTWCKEFEYALVRCGTRGTGKSEGPLDPFGLRRSEQIGDDAEGQDLYDIIEWIGVQPWNSGRVAMTGISYFGMVGYWAAIQQPPHLTCVVSYESLSDMYQGVRVGGVYSSNFHEHWYHNIVEPQGRKLGPNEEPRADYNKILETAEYPDQGPWPALARARDLSKIEVPFYSAGNWTDAELHLPGNINAFNAMSSKYKWLEMHTGNHLGAYYEDDHVQYQKKFLDYFMKDKHDNGQLDVPRVRLLIRQEEGDFFRAEKTFPVPDANNVDWFFTADQQLSEAAPTTPPKAFEYPGLSGSVVFETEPLKSKIEILGTPYLEVEVATEAQDLDLFVYLRSIKISGEPVIVRGNHDEPSVSFCRGFWRLSHRDENKGFPEYQVPHQQFAKKADVEKDKTYRVTVPLHPTSFVLRPGTKLQVEVGSVDEKAMIPPMRHEGGDRTKERFEGKNVFFSNGRIVIPTVER
ncbi:hypothetical protein PRZ48_009280 [Zasmidium cellare]|uniref:Xaa-Pro dipeptidyl-peptidase C-terminal domain-containing protein n=1 Tax=Zasmidium cellare TaxID=395010 RepID=A0ABR0EBA3_ZASCE|nr:hypothetical protein PRZ48_009280 [Zasmidium cellare]